MNRFHLLFALIISLLVVGCNRDVTLQENAAKEALPAEDSCQGSEINPVGEAIADEYESTSYEQVMAWFCDGAEFEDILVALETESQTEVPAEEMLQMLAEGFTWDEIWDLIGLTE